MLKLLEIKFSQKFKSIDKSDPRSYRLNSSKLIKIGFKPKKKIEDAIEELKENYKKEKLLNKSNFHSLKWLKKILS